MLGTHAPDICCSANSQPFNDQNHTNKGPKGGAVSSGKHGLSMKTQGMLSAFGLFHCYNIGNNFGSILPLLFLLAALLAHRLSLEGICSKV